MKFIFGTFLTLTILGVIFYVLFSREIVRNVPTDEGIVSVPKNKKVPTQKNTALPVVPVTPTTKARLPATPPTAPSGFHGPTNDHPPYVVGPQGQPPP